MWTVTTEIMEVGRSRGSYDRWPDTESEGKTVQTHIQFYEWMDLVMKRIY